MQVVAEGVELWPFEELLLFSCSFMPEGFANEVMWFSSSPWWDGCPLVRRERGITGSMLSFDAAVWKSVWCEVPADAGAPEFCCWPGFVSRPFWERLLFSKAGFCYVVLCGLKRERPVLARGVGSFQVLRSVSGSSSPSALLSPQREGGGAPLCPLSPWERETTHSVFPQGLWHCCRRTLQCFKAD